MRIRDLNLIRYGKFTGRHVALPASEQDIHLIVGPNEAGKSTLRGAIGDWLFGIPARTPLGFVHPMSELRLGGVIEQLKEGRSLAFERCKGNKNTLRSTDDAVLPDNTLQPWLGSLQQQAFNRMYALDHSTLVEGGAGILSSSDDIGRMLFQSAAGIEHLGDALKQLQSETDALWAPRKSAGRSYYQAQDQLEAATAAFKQATLRTRDWKTLHEALLTTEAALALARARDVELRLQLSRLERIRRVRPHLAALDLALAQRDELLAAGHTPLLPETAAQLLGAAQRELAVAAADQQRLQHDIAQTQSVLAATTVDDRLLGLAGEISELNARRLQFRAHRTDMLKLAEEIRLEGVRVNELARGLGWSAADEDAVRERLPAAPVRSRLQRLLKDRVATVQDLRAAQDKLAEREQQVQTARETLGGLAAAAVHPGLAAAVEQALELGDPAATTAALQQKLDSLRNELDTGLAALGPWRSEPQVLKAMLVPEMAVIQGLIGQQHSDALEAQSVNDALGAQTESVQRLELELQQLLRDFQPVSLDQVRAARRQRDSAWQGILQAPQEIKERATAFEAQVLDADHLADARLDRAQHEAARQAKAERLEHQRLELGALETRAAAVRARLAERLAGWRTQSTACGLPELPLEAAPVWLQQRQRALELLNEQAQAERQQAARRETAVGLQARLWALLDGAPAEGAMPELPECLRRARALIKEADQAQGQRHTLERQLHDGESSRVALQGALSSAQAAGADWERSWQDALRSAGHAATVLPDQVEAEIEVMQEIDQRLARMRSLRSERIDTMQADLNGLAESAASLAERAAPDLAGRAADDTALELAARLQKALAAADARANGQEALRQSQAALAAAQQQQQAAQTSLAPLMAAVGVDEVGALSEAIERSDRRRAVERQMQAAEGDLAQSADGLPLAALREEAAAIGPDELKAQLDSQSALAAAAVEEIAALSLRVGTHKTDLEALSGTADAAQAESRRQEAITAMAEAAERYLSLQTASRLLKWSMEKFRETRQGPMLGQASSIFRTLTLDAFNRLLVDTDGAAPRLFGIRAGGEQVEVAGMSEGTRDQLYLALRLAALSLQVDQGLSLPLIADDLFINFDDRRTKAGLQELGGLSRKMQVIFLTHHEHLVPLAREVLGEGLNVTHL